MDLTTTILLLTIFMVGLTILIIRSIQAISGLSVTKCYTLYSTIVYLEKVDEAKKESQVSEIDMNNI